MKKHMLLGGVLALVLLNGCSNQAPIDRMEQVKPVNVVTVEKTYEKETIRYTGYIRSRLIIPVASSQAGQIDSIHVAVGDRVSAGDVLVTARGADATEQSLYAPIDGKIAEIFLKSGDLMDVQTPILLVRESQMVVEIGVTSDDFKRIEKEAIERVEVNIDGISKSGQIDQMGQLPDTNSRLYAILVTIEDDKSLLLGEMAVVTFSLSGMNGIWLPIARILNDGEDYVLIVNAENRVERRNLKLLSLNNDRVRVEGLKAGDRVITVGYTNVKEGQLINAREVLDDKMD